MSYPPTPSKKSCNCEDACISTDDVYYAGPNLPNSGINTYNILTSVIEKLDAIYAVPTLQRVTETGNVTTLPIIADSFVKIGGNGTNVLLDNGTTISLSSIGGSQNLQEVTDIGAITTNPITANAFIKSGGDGNNLLLDDGTVLPISDLPVGVTKTSELINDGQDGIHPFITAEDIPAFVPSDYDLDEFTNNNVDPFAKISDLPVYSDFIQDSITNGVIDKAPTENAVYDALQLKQDSLGYTPVNKAGDTMLGDLILNQDPSTALQAATKQYVDNIVTGINFHPPVVVATDVSLVATYNNGIDGVGATLTGPSVGVLMIDGETPTYLQRILVWQQADPIQNGIYDLTTVGDSVTVYQLTRSADADNSPPGEIHYGDYTLVLSGDTNGGFGFICNTPGTIDIGTTPITYVQFNAAQAVTAGYGLEELTPNVISIDTDIVQEKITLTTTGDSGAATLISNTLNIPTLPQATTSVSGYLSSTDWTTFNNKANVNSQVFTGAPSLPTGTIGVTQIAGTNNTTLATTAFATTALAGKMNNPSLTASYIPKALTATTIGNSRLLDTGTYLGIDTVNTPTKDITLGYQANREIGIELSDSTTVGRDLTVTAGKTVNYSLNSDFVALNQAANTWNSVCGHVNGNVYATVNSGAASGGIYTQTGGIGNFNQTTSNFAGQIFSITCLPNGNIYVVTSFPGVYKQTNATGSFVADATAPTVSTASILASDTNNNVYLLISGGAIYKKTNDTGSFVLISITARNYNFITCHPNGNVYASVSNGDIYMQTGGTGDFNPLSQTSRTWSALACTSNGNVYAQVSSSIYIQTSGTGNFILQSGLTARNYTRLGADINGNIYGTLAANDIYKQINATLGTANLQGGTLKLNAGTGKGTGASDIEMWTGQVKPSGTDMQDITLRAKINNEGLMTLPSVTNALIEADTTYKAVVTKEYVNNRLVVETTSGYTLTNADSGGIIIFKTTAAQTLTIPTGLADGFECTFVTLSGVTLTVVSTGNTLNNNTGTTMLPQLSFTLKRMLATNTYIVAGSL